MNKKVLSMEEMNQVSGGIVVYDSGAYWALSDDGEWMCPIDFRTREDAQTQCVNWDWDPEFLSHEEFEKRCGFPFILSDYYNYGYGS